MHRKPQRHAQHHGNQRAGRAPGVVQQFLQGKGAQQGEHGWTVEEVGGRHDKHCQGPGYEEGCQ